MHKFLALLMLSVIAATGSLTAQTTNTYTFPDKDPTFSISFPNTWKEKEKDSSGYLEMSAPEDAIWIDIWVLAEGTNDDANTISDINKDMESWLTDIDVHRAPDGDTTIGGLKFTSYQGSAKTKEGDVQIIEADVCSPDGKNQVVVCYYGDKGASVQYKSDLATIFGSIKKL